MTPDYKMLKWLNNALSNMEPWKHREYSLKGIKRNVKLSTPHYKTFLNIKCTYIIALQMHKNTLFVFHPKAVIFQNTKEKLVLLRSEIKWTSILTRLRLNWICSSYMTDGEKERKLTEVKNEEAECTVLYIL